MISDLNDLDDSSCWQLLPISIYSSLTSSLEKSMIVRSSSSKHVKCSSSLFPRKFKYVLK